MLSIQIPGLNGIDTRVAFDTEIVQFYKIIAIVNVLFRGIIGFAAFARDRIPDNFLSKCDSGIGTNLVKFSFLRSPETHNMCCSL